MSCPSSCTCWCELRYPTSAPNSNICTILLTLTTSRARRRCFLPLCGQGSSSYYARRIRVLFEIESHVTPNMLVIVHTHIFHRKIQSDHWCFGQTRIWRHRSILFEQCAPKEIHDHHDSISRQPNRKFTGMNATEQYTKIGSGSLA